MEKKIILVSLIIIASFAFSADYRELHNPEVDDWYEVSDWELDVCSKWGGTGSAQDTYISIEGETRISQMELTLQASRTKTDQGYLYEVGWYIRPATGETEYTVSLGKDEEIFTGNALATTGDSGYEARNLEKDYSYCEIKYGDNSHLSVPVVDKEQT